MNAIATPAYGEIVEDVSEFFAPMSSDLVDSLVGEYDAARKRLENMAASVSDDACRGVLHYFVEGNVGDSRHSMPTTVEALFRVEGAVGQLNADFWNRALRMTDVIDYMPQNRRQEWFDQMKNPLGRKNNKHTQEGDLPPLPDFTDESVRATLSSLLSSRAQFLAERVDGIFRALSRQHVTNVPQGFGKRMIIANAFGYETSGHINDLRCVIAKFMGRDEPKHGVTDPVIKAARRQNGEWMSVDSGSLRIRVYGGVGTAHLEVHPEMAWRLNATLANLYPAAIPAEFREKPKRAKKIKDFVLFDKPLPFAVVAQLADMKSGWRGVKDGWQVGRVNIPNTRVFGYGDYDKASRQQAEKALAAIGGVWVKGEKGELGSCDHWAFDYEPGPVIDQVFCSGCIPDHRSHQFYPTPETVALAAIELADIQPGQSCLEPSAGQGGLADLMPKPVCIEISELHCEILKAKGHYVECADFLKWHITGKYDRIVMNPPYSEGRWQAHIEHASTMLANGGRLVAILPASAKGKDVLPGLNHEWSQVYSNEFAGTSVSVVILSASAT